MANGNTGAGRVVSEVSRVAIRAGVDIARLIAERDPDPIDVIRSADLVHLRCSFVNLRIDRRGNEPRLVRRATNRAAYLIMEWAPQHVVEQAHYQSADGIKPNGTELANAEQAEIANVPSGSTTNPALKQPPVRASMAGNSRVVFRVTDERIVFTVAGLLDAATRLPMNVVPHATPPPSPILWFEAGVLETVASPTAFIEAVLAGGANLPASWRSGVDASASALFARSGRAAATTSMLIARFGAETAGTFVASSALTVDRAVKPIDVGAIEIGRITALPAPPREPNANETALELPWRLIVSPSIKGGWAHSADAVDHGDRVELWHSRLGVRRELPDRIEVDERSAHYRTIRGVWARDFDVLAPEFAFDAAAKIASFPSADGTDDVPGFRMPLNSRDRMMIVHQTSNFTLPVTPQARRKWTPSAVPVNQLMLSSQGGWLKSRVQFSSRPGGTGLTLEEWKHIATLGRDHEVKVVYAGFLLPFGHRASLVKVSQRKFGSNIAGDPAFVYQRMFIIVREPVRQFRTSNQKDEHGHRLDLSVPFTSVRLLTEITPDIDEPGNMFDNGGYMFPVQVGGTSFGFKTVATDMEGNVVEFDAPMYFVEADQNDNAESQVRAKYNSATNGRTIPVGGQRIAFARSAKPDDTVVSAQTLLFDVVGSTAIDARSNTQPHFEPRLAEIGAKVPAAQALSGADTVTKLGYPATYLQNGFTGGEVFLAATPAAATTKLDFSSQGDRSGGFVTPSIEISGLSRLTGPIGGDISHVESGQFKPSSYFQGISAKLFGIISLDQLIPESAFEAVKVPKFIAEAVNVATTLVSNAERLGALAAAAKQPGSPPALVAAADDVIAAVDGLLALLDGLKAAGATAPSAAVGVLRDEIQDFVDAAVAATDVVSETTAKQISAIGRLLDEQLSNAAAVTAAAEALLAFAQGAKLPETLSARLDWSTELQPWPSTNTIFAPLGDRKLTLAVEIQAPVTSGGDPNVLVSCSLPAIDLRLIGDEPFMILHFQKMRFTLEPGKKPDVDIVFDPNDGIEFAGPLSFVETLKDVIPFDGFSDPPYLDVSTDGVKAGFDLALPSLAIGVFSLENISLGAHVLVPFIGESLEVGFNFCTRENPFRLTVSLFGGGGFFGVTLTPAGVRVLEIALEFGAAISINLGVASGGVEIMAGIYIRLEGEDATLTGYFRLRGEVDVLGLISASIELYLELTYETATGKAVGRATITVEVEVLFFSASVSISTEKKFAGANGDPTFADVMGLDPGAPPGAERPWDLYCGAFA